MQSGEVRVLVDAKTHYTHGFPSPNSLFVATSLARSWIYSIELCILEVPRQGLGSEGHKDGWMHPQRYPQNQHVGMWY